VNAPSATLLRRPNLSAFVGVFSATLLCFLAIGAVLPVLPRYVTGPLGEGDVWVGIVTGAFALTALVVRPIGGRLADRGGRRRVVLAGMLLAALAGALYFLPFGVAGLIFARLVLGIGDGWVFTAGIAWTIDLAPEERRGQAIAMYGLAIWGGLSLGPLIGEGLYGVAGFDAVWAFAALAPLAGAAVALRVPEPPRERHVQTGGRLIPRAALRPGAAVFLANAGYAAFIGFIVLHLAELGAGHGAAVFSCFAVAVVLTRVGLSSLPDRVGSRATSIAAALGQAAGLAIIAAADGLAMAVIGALIMGAGFSLLFPALALLVIERADERERGAAMGAFTSFVDLGIGLGAPLAGAISALAGYPAAFAAAAGCAALAALLAAVPSASRPVPGR
jgi:MFS family permease